ncbi:MAG TPA: ABC transporter permease [Caulobacteraceae bacterium]|nr:ABC transporter permease [Caulobacteraceae bacterium]
MTGFKLVLAFIGRRPLTWAFHALTLALGVAVITALLLLSEGLSRRFDRDLAHIDLVVGAKGSPLQLILSTVFALDNATGNIPLQTAEAVEHHPLVKFAVPVSLGDNYQGYRILGTWPSYGELYGAELAQGRWWPANTPMETVIGSEVARKFHMHLGQVFAGWHGLTMGGELHADTPYTVVGILKPTGAIIDRLVLTDISSVWKVHEHEAVKEEGLTPDEASAHRQVTAVLIKYKSTLGAIILPNMVKAMPDIQAAVPAMETARLVTLLGTGADVLRGFGLGLLGLSALGFFVALFAAVNQRHRELALLRALGARPGRLFALVAGEGLLLGLIGGLAGVALGRGAAMIAAAASSDTGGPALAVPAFGAAELTIVAAAVLLGFLASILPGLMAYRVNPAQTLQTG